MKSSVNEVWIKSAFYVFNTVFDREYNRKLKKDKKNSPAGIWTHNFEKNSHFRKELLKKSHFKRVTKKEWHHMNKALEPVRKSQSKLTIIFKNLAETIRLELAFE